MNDIARGTLRATLDGLVWRRDDRMKMAKDLEEQLRVIRKYVAEDDAQIAALEEALR